MVVVAAQPFEATRKTINRMTSRAASTPGRLRLISVSLALLTLVTGAVAALAVSTRQAATAASWQGAEPLLVKAQSVDTALSDADTTVAGSFLKGRIEPASLRQRYLTDIADASAALAAAAQEAGHDPVVAASIRTLSVDLPVYTGIVQTATFNERQGSYPLAAAYLAEANALMRAKILPAASFVYDTERGALAGDQSGALRAWLVWLAVLFVIALVVSLVATQRWLSNRFRRTVNVPLLITTGLVVILGVWSAVGLLAQDAGVDRARAEGSVPVAAFTTARILATQARGDDELTLLTRDSVSSYQSDYDSVAGSLHRVLAEPGPGVSPGERAEFTRAASAFDAYRSAHGQVRRLDASGDLNAAVALVSDSGTPGIDGSAARLESVLDGGIGSAQREFDRTTSGAADDLDGVVWGLAVGSVLAAVLILVGVRRRIEEYR